MKPRRHPLLALVGLILAALAVSACGSTAGTTAATTVTVTQTVGATPVTQTVTQTVAGSAAANADTPRAASPRQLVTLRGSGTGVHPADLSVGGYTATWAAPETQGGFTAVPMKADGSLDYSPSRMISSVETTGTVAFQSTGATTFQIGAQGPWTLTFTPLG